ncbi:chromodomain-helicase-DNA-binding protein 9-like [Paramormyrops kingsleyae]|uniref:chromodomain-helicase-DNA-binding protein 9-like n=1 Tax=Paramormyrops kingsleyae TaxID=1676925 RepID=UPI003B96C982
MTDPIMDLFDEQGLFAGGLEDLSEQGFAVDTVSLVDELGLNPEFEPLRVDPQCVQKPPGPPAAIFSQPDLAFEPTDTALSQPPQYQRAPPQRAAPVDRPFPDSSPMWGNQELAVSPFQQVAPQRAEQLPQSGCFQLPQQGLDPQPLPQADFYPADPSLKQQQVGAHDPSSTLPLNVEHGQSPFCQGDASSALGQLPTFLDTPSGPLSGRLPQQGGPQYPGSTVLSSCLAGSGPAYTPYSVHGQLAVQPPSSASVIPSGPGPVGGMLSSTFSGMGDEFSFGPEVSQQQPGPAHPGESGPFQDTDPARQAPGGYGSVELFPEALCGYGGTVTQQRGTSDLVPPSVTNNTSYQALEESLLQQVGVHASSFEGLDPPDLLEDDLLPQLEAALNQETALVHQESPSYPWPNGNPPFSMSFEAARPALSERSLPRRRGVEQGSGRKKSGRRRRSTQPSFCVQRRSSLPLSSGSERRNQKGYGRPGERERRGERGQVAAPVEGVNERGGEASRGRQRNAAAHGMSAPGAATSHGSPATSHGSPATE